MGRARAGTDVDWVNVVEAVYAEAPTNDAWLERVLDAARVAFGDNERTGLIALRHSPDCASAAPLLSGGFSDLYLRDDHEQWLARLGPSLVRDMYYPPEMVTTHTALSRRIEASTSSVVRSARERFGIVDALGLMLHPEPGVAGVLFVARTHTIALSRQERQTLTRVAIHAEAAFRLRLKPEAAVAVITPEGRILHREAAAPHGDSLAHAVKTMETSRLRRHRREPEALETWTALVEGRVSLVERSDGGRRVYLVVDNAPARQAMRALTQGELDVLGQAARGLSSKLVGYALGIAPARVAARLRSAADKLGLATPIELIRIAAILARDPRAGFADIALTTAERDVLELLALGLTNAEIALLRNRSVRTIANQVAALLRKTQSPTRRALVAAS